MDRDYFDFNRFADLEPQEREFPYKGKALVVKEASFQAARDYRNAIANGARFRDGELERTEDAASADTVLLQQCLFEVKASSDGAKTLVGLADAFVSGMPNRVTKPLVKWVKEVSDLIEEEETVAEIDKSIDRLRKRREKLLADGIAEGKAAASPSTGPPSG